MKRNIACYLKGFAKGLGLTTLFLLLTYIYPNYDASSLARAAGYLFSIITAAYLVRKYKAPRVWIVLSLVISALVFPFLLGAVEVEKNKRLAVTK